MKIYVANTSIQEHVFCYRFKGQARMRQVPIAHMSQSPLPDDFDKEQLDDVIKQQEKYGFISAEEITGSRPKRARTLLCYSIDRPVSAVRIEALHRSNLTILDAQGKQFRRDAAIAADVTVEAEVERSARAIGAEPPDVGNFRMEITEDEPNKGFDRPTSTIVNEEIAVTSGKHPAPQRANIPRQPDRRGRRGAGAVQ